MISNGSFLEFYGKSRKGQLKKKQQQQQQQPKKKKTEVVRYVASRSSTPQVVSAIAQRLF